MGTPTSRPKTSSPGGIKLGVIDFGIITEGKTARQVLEESKRLAPLAESLGYTRYWMVEHHESHYAWACPEVMIPFIAQQTESIRVGSAAVLLPLYSPLKVAEVFRLLECLYPGRVDLGVCAGVPLDEVALRALLDEEGEEPPEKVSGRYERKLERLLDYLRCRFPEGHRFERGATPAGENSPPVWLMGTGPGNVKLSASHGTSFSYSLFHRASRHDPSLTRRYCDTFKPSAGLSAPQFNVAFSCICAETEEKARRQKEQVERWLKGGIVVNLSGTPEQCGEQILEMQDRYAAEEFIVHSLWHSYEERVASYHMLAEALDLDAARKR
jgi:luciferase family oxidoreductase group 1